MSNLLNRLRESVYRVPFLINHDRSLYKVLDRPLQQSLYKYHWSVQDVWDWPRAVDVEWRDLKKESVSGKLEALKRRGKGPLCKNRADDSKGKKKRK